MRLWASLDLAVTLPMALPGLAFSFVQALFTVNGWFGGRDAPGPADPLYLFFLMLAGALGVTWAVARLLYPQAALAVIDSVARVWVAGVICYSVEAFEAPAVLYLFVATELAGAAHQGWTVFRRR